MSIVLSLSQNNTVQLLGSVTDFLWTHVNNHSDYDRDVVQRVGESALQGFSNAVFATAHASNKAADSKGSSLKKVTAEIILRWLLLILLEVFGQSMEARKMSDFINYSWQKGCNQNAA